MATALASVYFPALDECFSGRERLISWRTAYYALQDAEAAEENESLRSFFEDEATASELFSALEHTRKARDTDRKNFETKTAPIHIAQSACGDYNLDQIKNDALWLAKEFDEEDLVALRIVVLDWQERPRDRLLNAVEGGAIGDTEGNKLSTLIPQSPPSLTAATKGSAEAGPDSGDENVRHLRLVKRYHDERTFRYELAAGLICQHTLASRGSTPNDGASWIAKLAATVTQKQCGSPEDHSTNEKFCSICLSSLQKLLEDLNDLTRWPKVIKTLLGCEKIYVFSSLHNIAITMRCLLSQIYRCDRIPGQTTCLAWFQFMDQANFFQDLQTEEILLGSTIQSLAAMVSLAFLELPKSIALQHGDAESEQNAAVYPRLGEQAYCTDNGCLESLNTIFFRAAEYGFSVASPAIYAWSLLTLHIRNLAADLKALRQHQQTSDFEDEVEARSSSYRSSDASIIEKRWHVLQDPTNGDPSEDPAAHFALVTVDRMNVYNIMQEVCSVLLQTDPATAAISRRCLYDLLNEGRALVGYGEEMVETLLALLQPEASTTSPPPSILMNALPSDHGLIEQYALDQAFARYPYELSPLLRILTLLIAAQSNSGLQFEEFTHILENLKTITLMVPETFRSYQLENEEENSNSIVLTQDLYLFMPREAAVLAFPRIIDLDDLVTQRASQDDHAFVVPAGASGTVIREERPMVIRFDHNHSALVYFGLLLSSALPESEIVSMSLGVKTDCFIVAELVNLVVALLRALLKQQNGVQDARFLLGRMSYAVHEEQDVVTIITELFEIQLLAYTEQAAEEGSLEVLIACADFFDIMLLVSAERVWPVLGRSSLLGLSGMHGALADAVGVAEVPTGRFRFLAACTRLHTHLVDDAMNGLMRRKANPRQVTNRFDSPMQSPDSTPERTMSAVLKSFSKIMLEVFRNLSTWHFVLFEEKTEIATGVVTAFHLLIRASYGLEPPIDQVMKSETGERRVEKKERITAILAPAAEMVIQNFAPEVGSSDLLDTIGDLSQESLTINDDTLSTPTRRMLVQHIQTLANFLSTVLRTAYTFAPARASSLGRALLGNVQNFAMLFASDNALKSSMSALLGELARGIAAVRSDPPPLLAVMNLEAGKAFLGVVAQLDCPLRDVEVEVEIWNFLSAVLFARQQWFAMFVLTGTVPSSRSRDHKSCAVEKSRDSLFTFALNELSRISMLKPERAKAMLRFVNTAQSLWVWATSEIRAHGDFIRNILDWLAGLRPPTKSWNKTQSLISANEHRMAACICDILAVNLHASLEIGDQTLLKQLVHKLSFLYDHAVSVDAYNRSLHWKLAENLADRYPQCTLADFKRTTSNAAPYGKMFRYDLELADRILGHDVAWNGTLGGRGFVEEVERANINLSLVDAQSCLLRSWRALATTLAECIELEPTLTPALARSAQACIQASTNAASDISGVMDALQSRAELAFVLATKLVAVKASDVSMKDLLPAAFDLIRASSADYDVTSAFQDLQYFRLLLQILYLTLQPYIYMNTKPATALKPIDDDNTTVQPVSVATAALLMDIVRRTIAPSFLALCSNLHEDTRLAEPSDFALITALLQAVLAVPDAQIVQTQIAEDLAHSNNVVRAALSLFSWSDQLAEMTEQDPIYGEAAISILLTLSSVRPIAEQMALDGVLAQLGNANLSNYFRKPGGRGPFDEPGRMFVVWAEGFLPLCLNLLDAVGPPIAADVATFLNSFPEQLARAEAAFETEVPGRRTKPHSGDVTLGLVAEAHSLVMIGLILRSDAARGAAEGINAAEIQPLAYDIQQAKERVDALPRTPRSLKSKIVPTNAREFEWTHTTADGSSDNLLMAKVLNEMKQLSDCFAN